MSSKTAVAARRFFERQGQTLVNLFLFLLFSSLAANAAYQAWRRGEFHYGEVAFALHSLVFVTFLLVRRRHASVDRNWKHQAIALLAFGSGAALMGQPATGGELAGAVSRAVICVANVAGMVVLLNLGRSFGIMIALREVKTGGLYSVVRHPMYGTDILLRIGFLIGHLSAFTVVVFVASTACYVYRALLEERFLSRQPEYVAYMSRVRYRFIPYLW